MLNSAEHEILNAQKYKIIKKLSIFQDHISLEWYISCELSMKNIISVPGVIGIQTHEPVNLSASVSLACCYLFKLASNFFQSAANSRCNP